MEHLLTLAETTGLGVFFYYLVRGLRTEISALKKTIIAQRHTLQVMEKRVEETKKVGDIYRDLLSSLPQDLENFKTVVSKTKDEVIVELSDQNAHIKTKLKEAERQINDSGNPRETVNAHLRVLSNLVSERKAPASSAELDLLKICEHGNRSIEHSVPL